MTALQIWQFQGIAEEMLANWRSYCRPDNDNDDGDGDGNNSKQCQFPTKSGE